MPERLEYPSLEYGFRLPAVIADLVRARDEVREHYRASHEDRLRFTFDGNLVGDIGEALATQYFGVDLSRRGTEGSDGSAPDGTTVQVKATSTWGSALFRDTELQARRLLFFSIDFASCSAAVVFNGLEEPVRAKLNPPWEGQKSLTMLQMIDLDRDVAPCDRLLLVQA